MGSESVLPPTEEMTNQSKAAITIALIPSAIGGSPFTLAMTFFSSSIAPSPSRFGQARNKYHSQRRILTQRLNPPRLTLTQVRREDGPVREENDDRTARRFTGFGDANRG